MIAIENARLFQEIQDKNEQLEAANRHKSQFLANVSHELRTPLNSIIGFTRIVQRRTRRANPRSAKGESPEGSDQLGAPTQPDQRASRPRQDRIGPHGGLRRNVPAKRRGPNGDLDRGADVKGWSRPFGDRDRSGHPAIKNRSRQTQAGRPESLSNAAKFTERGEIKVAAWQENGNVKLTVSDTGIGMKKEALDYIFEEFRQADMSSTRRYGGTGLGLAIVRRFINLMGGEIGVESEVGKGSKFTITIPIALKVSNEA